MVMVVWFSSESGERVSFTLTSSASLCCFFVLLYAMCIFLITDYRVLVMSQNMALQSNVGALTCFHEYDELGQGLQNDEHCPNYN